MTETKKERRIKIEAELAMGKSAKDLADKYDMSYQTIQLWKRKLDEDAPAKDVEVLVQTDPRTLHTIAEAVKKEAPAAVVAQIDKVVDGITSIQQLEPQFHAVVLNLLNKAEELSSAEDLSIRDWKVLGDGISSMYANIFNKSGVSVNVLNQTQVSGEKLSLFKSSMKG